MDGKREKEILALEETISTPTPPSLSSRFKYSSIYIEEELNAAILYRRPTSERLLKRVKRKVRCHPMTILARTFPILQWLSSYKWRKDLTADIISGITVAVMHIPQGMAYGLIGNVPPVVGIYMAVFPVLVYALLGTSRHASIGTFAVVCLMTGKIVAEQTQNDEVESDARNVQVAVTVTFCVGITHLIMYVCRLGVVTNLLSDVLVNAFTCACAFHVVSSQLKDLFGLTIVKPRGKFAFVLTLIETFKAIPSSNHTAFYISLVTVTLLTLNNEILKPVLAKYTKIPFPIELVAVLCGTGASYAFDFNARYNVSTVGDIPTGFPDATIPDFALMPTIMIESAVIALISFVVTMSMALILAHKAKYEVDGNQELLAMGCANTCGAFVSCMPITASLSRSLIQLTVGGVTQLASFVSCLILIVVLLWIGPVFSSLPRSVLASIIVVALKNILLQFRQSGKFWKMSRWDGFIWMVTFFTTLLIAIDIGLAAGLAISLVCLFYQSQAPYTCLLGYVPNTGLYMDVSRFHGAEEIPGIKIFQYCGGLNFASKASFKSHLYKKIYGTTSPPSFEKRPPMTDDGDIADGGVVAPSDLSELRCVVLDFSAVTFVDPAGVALLREIATELYAKNIDLLIAGCTAPIFEVFKRCDRYDPTRLPTHAFKIFPRVGDAVLFAKSAMIPSIDSIGAIGSSLLAPIMSDDSEQQPTM